MSIATIDKSWTLFLDRDGVINYENVGDYITRWQDFRFYDGVLEALKSFASHFGRIVIVTNQRGVSKGLMSEHDLKDIHANMLGQIEAAGGRIDKVYYCVDMEGPNRKPNPGMGWKAKKDFPEIIFSRSVMIGNTMGDMKFGKNIGAYTIFITSNRPAPELPDEFTDMVQPSLSAAAASLTFA